MLRDVQELTISSDDHHRDQHQLRSSVDLRRTDDLRCGFRHFPVRHWNLLHFLRRRFDALLRNYIPSSSAFNVKDKLVKLFIG